MVHYYIKANENYPESAHNWWVKRDGFLLGQLFTSEKDAKTMINLLQNHQDLLDTLQEISEGKGRYNQDRLQHAENTIQDMRQLAVDAIANFKLLMER